MPNWIYGDPALSLDGKSIYIAGRDRMLRAVDPLTGELQWYFDLKEIAFSDPTVGPDGTIYVGARNSLFYAISPKGERKWFVLVGGLVDTSAALSKDGTTAYFGSADTHLYAVDTSNGRIKWKYKTDKSIISSPLVDGNGTIYFVASVNPAAWHYKMEQVIDGDSVPSPVALFAVLVLMLLNLFLRKVGLGRLAFSRGELIVIYVMVMVGGLIVGRTIMLWLPFAIMALPKYVLMMNQTEMADLFDKTPSLIMPKGFDAAQSFYMGGPIPWGDWAAPIVTWTLFILVMYFTILCMLTLVRARWTSVEHLIYPLAVPVVRLTEPAEDGSPFGAFWRDKLVWMGMLVPILYFGINGLARYLPAIPVIPSLRIPFTQLFKDEPFFSAFRHYPALEFNIGSPLSLGVGYMISLQLNFSIWFSFLLWRFGMLLWYAGGGPGNDIVPVKYTYEWATRVAFAIWLLWGVRKEIKAIFVKAFGGKPELDIDDRDEIMPYKVAVFGWIFGMAFMVIFAVYFLSASVLWALLYFLVLLSMIFVHTRFRAELGIPEWRHVADRVEGSAFMYLSPSAIGRGSAFFSNLLYYPFQLTGLGGVTAATMEGYFMGDYAKVRRRGFTAMILLVLLVGILSMWYFSLNTIHSQGGLMADYSTAGTVGSFIETEMKRFDTLYKNADVPAFIFFIFTLGFGVTALLIRLHSLYTWWPVHPVGWVLATYNPLGWGLWSHLFLAWLIKFLVVRYGGHRVATRLQSFFLGLIVGQVIMSTFWGLVGVIL